MTLLAVLLSAAQAASPPPIVPFPAPIAVRTVPPFSPVRGEVAPMTIDVEARGGDAMLWSGTLRLGQGPASVNYEISDAGSDCSQSYGRSQRALRLTFVSASGTERPLNLQVRWTRPIDGPCGAAPPSRTVEVSQPVSFDERGIAVVEGDAGLVVRIRRH